MKKVLMILLSVAFVTSFLYFIIEVLIISNIKPDWEKIDSKTVGTITRISSGKGGGAWFSYTSDGELHEEYDGLSENGLTIGEKYWIQYCSTCSNMFTAKIKSIAYLPLFTKDENYFETTATITKINKFKWWGKGPDSRIYYTYYPIWKGEKYERSQTLPPNYKQKYPNLTVGQKYRVKVWDLDVKRAIIDLDKPIEQNK